MLFLEGGALFPGTLMLLLALAHSAHALNVFRHDGFRHRGLRCVGFESAILGCALARLAAHDATFPGFGNVLTRHGHGVLAASDCWRQILCAVSGVGRGRAPRSTCRSSCDHRGHPHARDLLVGETQLYG